ncbi:Asp/Glu/hydantoin racemase [Haloterrigena turkmenica DSM 5511]|uniref:Asp/Glu/hydantoin racemase n=1 Tax=Haloterrigena turkmenica (strain ATCC 51198 / DSM 5511 / JCM 9101 / NCIMB 13204 / VKM B-1734 / 4k) TaxID=543526 RepID=D2RR36_HALTV|nr:aspartate/glutamate racemase family protein [Haloterrigena turkmenica]ADB62432.1 Asp/Glu/hydantoin racemase [Haloterrigena turkmenica DSM 5511]
MTDSDAPRADAGAIADASGTDDTAGVRGRLGLIVPSSNTTAESEFRRALPDDVTVHGARMALESVTVDELDAMSDDAARAAELLGHADVDAVAYACTTGSLLHGPGFDAELEDRLSEAAGVPAIATARSVVRALEALDAERIAVVTPYTADLDAKEREFLEAAGFEVASIDGRGLEANTAIGALTPDDAVQQVIERVDGDELDAVFVSCTNYRSLAAVGSLESKLGVPVLTSNGATLWDVCGVAGLEVDLDGLGTLRECERP